MLLQLCEKRLQLIRQLREHECDSSGHESGFTLVVALAGLKQLSHTWSSHDSAGPSSECKNRDTRRAVVLASILVSQGGSGKVVVMSRVRFRGGA